MEKKKPEICDCCWGNVGVIQVDIPLGGNNLFGVGESCMVCESCGDLPFAEVIEKLYARINAAEEGKDAT